MSKLKSIVKPGLLKVNKTLVDLTPDPDNIHLSTQGVAPMQARFIHDCTNPGCCTLVGTTNRYDVYLTRSDTLVMRWGDAGPDYDSLPLQLARRVAKDDPAYHHAVRLADAHVDTECW